jgi:hypothetical protein
VRGALESAGVIFVEENGEGRGGEIEEGGEMKGEPLTIEEIEAANPYPDDGRIPHVPFGFGSVRWEQFQGADATRRLDLRLRKRPGNMERAGYVLVREGKPIGQIVTLMN